MKYLLLIAAGLAAGFLNGFIGSGGGIILIFATALLIPLPHNADITKSVRTKLENGKYYTAGGRVLGVTATGSDLREALDKAYKAVDTITFEKAHHRNDIGQRALRAL